MGDDNFEEFGGDAIKALTTFTLHLLRNSSTMPSVTLQKVKSSPEGWGEGIAQMPWHPHNQKPGKFGTTLAKIIEPIDNIKRPQ